MGAKIQLIFDIHKFENTFLNFVPLFSLTRSAHHPRVLDVVVLGRAKRHSQATCPEAEKSPNGSDCQSGRLGLTVRTVRTVFVLGGPSGFARIGLYECH